MPRGGCLVWADDAAAACERCRVIAGTRKRATEPQSHRDLSSVGGLAKPATRQGNAIREKRNALAPGVSFSRIVLPCRGATRRPPNWMASTVLPLAQISRAFFFSLLLLSLRSSALSLFSVASVCS